MNLSITILYVEDVARSRVFYDAVFGWEKTVDEPVYVEYRLSGSARLGLMRRAGARSFLGDELGDRIPGPSPKAELYFSFEDAGTVREALGRAGAVQVSPPLERDWGERVAYYLDPDQHVIGIGEPL